MPTAILVMRARDLTFAVDYLAEDQGSELLHCTQGGSRLFETVANLRSALFLCRVGGRGLM